MKKVVEGKTYNTETAKEIGGVGHYGIDGFYIDLYLRRGDKELFGILNSKADSNYSGLVGNSMYGYSNAVVLDFNTGSGFDEDDRTIYLNDEYYKEFEEVTKNIKEEI